MTWRGGKKSGGDSTKPSVPGGQRPTPSSGADRQWKQKAGTQLIDRSLTRRLKLAAYSLVSLALIGWLIAKLLFVPRPTPLVSFTCVGFPFPMPPNALATEDTQLLTSLSAAHSNLRCTQVNDTWGNKAEFLAAVREQAAKLRGGGPGRNTAVFQISAHGAVDEQNEPCLMLPVSDPLDSSTWVPMREVLTALGSTETLSSVNKLLLLDAGKIQQDWSLGIVYNSFPERLAEIVTELAIPHLAVINSTGTGQASCLMPEAGASTFGYFLAEGLREAARGRDHQVSLHELHRFLMEQVDGFARTHRSESQQPMLLPPDAPDFPLVYVTGTAELANAPLEFTPRLDELDSRWQDFSRLSELPALHSAPMDWAEAEQRLLRLEQLLIAGKSYQQQYSSNDAQLRSVLEKLKTHRRLAEADFSSLAIAQQFDPVDPQQQAAAIEKYEAWRQALRTPNPEQPIPLPTLPFRLASQTAWQSLLTRQPTADDLDAVLQLVDGAADRAPLDFDEIHFLRVLRQDLDWLGPAASQLAQVLAVQQRAQQVVASREFRSHYWLDHATRRTDPLLREGWDNLLVGREDTLQAAQTLWTQLLADDAAAPCFASIAQLDDLGRKAYRTRDVALAKLKHFSSWLASSDQSFAGQATVDRSRLWTNWRELAQHTHRLGQALNGVAERVVTVDPLVDVRQHQERTEQLLGEMETAFADECRRLWVENANDQATLKQIGVTLQVPLLPGNDVRIRNELRRRYFSRRFASTDLQSSGDEAAASGSAERYLAQVTDLDPHPALAILDRRIVLGEEPSASTRELISESELNPSDQTRQQSSRLRRVAAIGGEIRSRLRGMDAERTKLANQTQQALSRNELPLRARLGLSQADHLLRAAATLLQQRSWKAAADDPSVQLEKLDTQFFFFWQASRALDDFWGPAQPDTPEYFTQRTAQLLTAARRHYGEATPHREALETLAADRTTAAGAWHPINAGDLHFTADEKLVRHQIDVLGDTSIPAGTMAVLLQRTDGDPIPLTLDGQRASHRRQPADVQQSQTLQHWIANDERLETTALDSVALFRGHRRPVTFFVDAGANATVSSYVRPDTPPARIRVSGDSRQAMQVIFILDCSYSMRFKHKVENRIVSRMELATDALTEIVRQLDGSEYQIGLVLYGHRAGWMDNKIRLRDPQRDRGLHPGADVEVVIPVTPIMRPNLVTGRIEDTRQSFFAALEGLTPYGETPLYYAIARASESFHSGPAGTRNIVVITDGSDRQSPDAPASAKRGLQDLQSLLADPERKIRIDMIGFRADPDLFDSEFDQTDWTKNEKPRWEGSPKSGLLGLTSATGGAFHDVTKPGQLAQALRDSLRVARFQVRAKSAPADASDELDLSREWVAPSSQVKGDFIVNIVDQPAEPLPLKIEGGEAFSLTYNRSQQRLEHRRFDDELLGSGLQLPAGSSPQFFVGSHIPQRQGRDEVWFRLSVQNADPTQFSSRPAAVWAEFRPILANGTRAESVSYFAYDCEFEPGRPVPALRFRIAGWPFEAERAEVNVWFSPSRPSIKDLPLDLTQPSQIDTIPQVPMRVQTQRAEDGRLVVTVDEEHSASSTLYPLWLHISPAPDGVRHTFVNDARRVRHEFTFKDPAGVLQSKPRLQVTHQQDLKQHWIATGPIEVELPHR